MSHNETIEVNQELAWEIDKKSLQLHKLQRNVIKVNLFALSEADGAREHVGYLVLDVRSAADGSKVSHRSLHLESHSLVSSARFGQVA